MITTFENRCVLNIYVIALRPIFDTAYKGGKRSKYSREHYITNWSYSKKVGIIFAVYQIMISKGTSWDVPRCWLAAGGRCGVEVTTNKECEKKWVIIHQTSLCGFQKEFEFGMEDKLWR